MKVHRKRRLGARICSILLAVAMIITMTPTVNAAEIKTNVSVPEGISEGLCEHHPVHTGECGYAEAAEEQTCNHVCGTDCYEKILNCTHEHGTDCYDAAELASDSNADPVNCGHVHDDSCYDEVLKCPHVHDDQCGYAEAVEGTPCQYNCEICGKEEPKDAKEKEYPTCISLEESSRFLDELLRTDRALNEAVSEYGADSEEAVTLQAQDDAMWAHVDQCEFCKEQLGVEGAYYEKFYGIETLEGGDVGTLYFVQGFGKPKLCTDNAGTSQAITNTYGEYEVDTTGKKLILKGFNYTTKEFTALMVKVDGYEIVLADGTENSIISTSVNTGALGITTSPGVDLKISGGTKGNGTLTVSSGGWGIYSNGSFTLAGGEVIAEGKSEAGIQCNTQKSFKMTGGTLTARGGKYAILYKGDASTGEMQVLGSLDYDFQGDDSQLQPATAWPDELKGRYLVPSGDTLAEAKYIQIKEDITANSAVYFMSGTQGQLGLYTDDKGLAEYPGKGKTWQMDGDKLVLKGLSIETSATPALELSADCEIVLADGTNNSIVSTADNGYGISGPSEGTANLTISAQNTGDGSLRAAGKAAGIHVNAVTINGGVVEADGSGTSGKGVEITGGGLSITGGTLTAKGQSTAVSGMSASSISGFAAQGTVNYAGSEQLDSAEEREQNGAFVYQVGTEDAKYVKFEKKAAGYTYNSMTGKLTISSNEGSVNWRTDTNINHEFVYSVEIGTGVTELGGDALKGTGISEIVIPEGVTTLAGGALSGCPELEKISLPSTITNMGGGTIADNPKLKSITIAAETPPRGPGPDSMESILRISRECAIYVPVGKVQAYLNTGAWEEYAGQIYEMSITISLHFDNDNNTKPWDLYYKDESGNRISYTEGKGTTWSIGNDDALKLNGFEFSTNADVALELGSGAKIFLEPGSVNKISNAKNAGVPAIEAEDFAIVTVSGSGQLTASSPGPAIKVGRLVVDMDSAGVLIADANNPSDSMVVGVGLKLTGSETLDIKGGKLIAKTLGHCAYESGQNIQQSVISVSGSMNYDGTGLVEATPRLEGGVYKYYVEDSFENPAKYLEFTKTEPSESKKKIIVEGITLNNKAYDGKPAEYTGTPTVKDKETNEVIPELSAKLTVKWQKKDNEGKYQDISEEPRNAGEYKLVMSVPADNAEYGGDVEFPFTISKKEVTLKPKDVKIKAGEALPKYELDYSVLAEGDKLEPSVTPDITANVTVSNKTGTYKITWNNAGATTFTGAAKENYEIKILAEGTLTIDKKDGDNKKGIIVEGITLKNKAYDGKTASYTGTPTVKDKETNKVIPELSAKLTVKWQKKTNEGKYQDIKEAPRNAGEYKLVMSVPADNAEYGGDVEFPFTINKKKVFIMPKAVKIKAGEAIPKYELDYSVLAEGDKLEPSVTPDITANVTDPNKAGTYIITWNNAGETTFTGAAKENYEIQNWAIGALTISEKDGDNKKGIIVEGITLDEKAYDGKTASYTGTPTVKDKETNEVIPELSAKLTVKWQKKDDKGNYQDISEAPRNAGEYRLVMSVPADNAEYGGDVEFPFTIGKRSVTVKPKDLAVVIGETKPVFTLEYTGLIAGETLTPSVPPVFTDNAGDLSKAGTYTITWSNAGVTQFTGTMALNYDITTSGTGTFTVKKAKGYEFDRTFGKLTVISDEGLRDWMSDTSINKKDLVEVDILEDVKNIPDNAFNGYQNLRRVNVRGNDPAALGAGAFDGTASGLKIYVPKGRSGVYKSEWKPYQDKIVENDKLEVMISGVSFEGKKYDGKPAAYTGTVKALVKGTGENVTEELGTLSVRWQRKDADGSWSDLSTAPKNAGNYRLVISVPESVSGYYGSEYYPFAIGKRAVTVGPKSETVILGGSKPTYTLEYTGLVEGETLTPSVVPAFTDNVTDTSKEGTYTVTWSNKDAITFAGSNNYEITLLGTGTLLIISKGSSASSSESTASAAGTNKNYLPKNYKGGTKVLHDITVPDYTVEGVWKLQDNGKWRLSGPDGSDYVDCWVFAYNPYANASNGQNPVDWFLFDKDGNMVPGWYTDELGNTYYLNPFLDLVQGSMATGWKFIDGKWYYFNEEPDGTRGKLLRNTTTPDGYRVNEKGEWVQ